MPNPLFSVAILAVLFIVSFAVCFLISFALLIKQNNQTERENPQEKIYYVETQNKRKKRKQSKNTVAIRGTLLSPEEIKRKN